MEPNAFLLWRASIRCCSHAPKRHWRSAKAQFRQLSSRNGPASAAMKDFERKFVPLRADYAYIALGSNIGDRIGHIEKACREFRSHGLEIKRTSALYETAPMYVEDQGHFINGVCEESTLPTPVQLARKTYFQIQARVEHDIGPLDLLARLKSIEQKLGRQKSIDKGPRNIDLDIVLYGKRQFEDADLCIPHRAVLEREFVLRPLCDLIPDTSHPGFLGVRYSKYLSWVTKSKKSMNAVSTLTPRLPLVTPDSPTRPTQIMGILNLTPDSFSDGGVHPLDDPSALLPTIRSYLSAGCTILDIGGQSTAPHAPQVSASEELSRILPTIQLLRSLPEFSSLAISVDTYRASVARAAIEEGADLVNDVSAGTLDPEMLPTVAALGCSIVLMHMRGTPETMNSLTDYNSNSETTSNQDSFLATLASELQQRVAAAEDAGIRRWRIVLDPGIGFAKTQAQNLQILARLAELRAWPGLTPRLPWLVGASRKKFVGKVTGVETASERVWGTAAAMAAAVQGGADVVRVHDVAAMGQVVRMGDAIWRVDRSGDGGEEG